MALLDSGELKLDRARAHLQVLDDEVNALFESDPYPVVHEIDPARAYHRFKLRLGRALPAHWPLIVGDCAHNARSALDHLAWNLAGADPSDSSTQFPIFADPEKFGRAVRQYAEIPKRPAALVKWLQPYRRVNPLDDDLWALQVLDAEDKHKTVSLALCTMESFDLTPVVPPRSRLRHEITVTFGPFDPSKDDAVIAEGTLVAFPLDGGPENPEVEVDFKPALDIAIRAENAGATFLPGRVVLGAMIDCVERVLALFGRL